MTKDARRSKGTTSPRLFIIVVAIVTLFLIRELTVKEGQYGILNLSTGPIKKDIPPCVSIPPQENHDSNHTTAITTATTSTNDLGPRLGDGCYHVFIDAGSNRGVHGRFLFEPEKYNESIFVQKFDKVFGTNRTLQNICVFAFEPNVEFHNASQMATQQAYAKMKWRYHYMPYGVSDHDGTTAFYRNRGYIRGAKREEYGFGVHNLEGGQGQKATVQLLDLSKWMEHHVFGRDIPPKNPYNTMEPKVAMKLDVEGSEFRLLFHMLNTGTACKLDHIIGELHFPRQSVVPEFFAGMNVTGTPDMRAVHKFNEYRLSKPGCPGFDYFDDEQYLHDGMPYPEPPE